MCSTFSILQGAKQGSLKVSCSDCHIMMVKLRNLSGMLIAVAEILLPNLALPKG